MTSRLQAQYQVNAKRVLVLEFPETTVSLHPIEDFPKEASENFRSLECNGPF